MTQRLQAPRNGPGRIGLFSLHQPGAGTPAVAHKLDRPLVEYCGEMVPRERLIWTDSNNPEDWVNEAADDLDRENRYQLVDRLNDRIIDQEVDVARSRAAFRASVDRVKYETRVRQVAAREMADEDRAVGHSTDSLPEWWRDL